jgi:acyl-CoA synthetase (AMP-forming)/AMP-acid ligase II
VGAPASFNMADVWEMAADAVPEREALVVGEQRLSYGELEDRANRLAHHLAAQGIGPGDHLALYLENCTEYLEAMLAAWKIRAVPINVNHRYVADELRYLLDNSDSVGVITQSSLAETVAAVVPGVPAVRFTLVTGDEYEAGLVAASGERPVVPGRGDDDHYVIYTGGTTGMPKGVVWRHADAFFSCIGGGDPMRLHGPVDRPDELPDRIGDSQVCYLPLAPMMHAAAQWTSFSWLFAGSKVVLMPRSLDGDAVWRAVAAEKVNLLTVVGDAVARPVLDAWDRAAAAGEPYDASSLFSVSNGGAPMSPATRERIFATLPHVMVTDGFGSSEAGTQGAMRVAAGEGRATTTAGGAAPSLVRFDQPAKPTIVVDAADPRGPEVVPGSGVAGQVLAGGRLPLRYHNDPEKTAATFVEREGERWLVTGDVATVGADGAIELLGRGSVSINTGGEKVHPEEVESVLKAHPDVYDCLVVGVPDERWGSAVTAVVQPAPGAEPALADLAAHCKGSLAGYKAPKHLVVVDRIVRSPSGKADYRWAKRTAEASAPGSPVG